MIDNSEAGAWAAALEPDRRSLKYLSEAELHSPFILEKIQQWWGCDMGTARDAVGAELRRRTTTTDFPKGE